MPDIKDFPYFKGRHLHVLQDSGLEAGVGVVLLMEEIRLLS